MLGAVVLRGDPGEFRGALQRILDLGARREDGLARLAAAAAGSGPEEAGK